jgi:hypothetical protein
MGAGDFYANVLWCPQGQRSLLVFDLPLNPNEEAHNTCSVYSCFVFTRRRIEPDVRACAREELSTYPTNATWPICKT